MPGDLGLDKALLLSGKGSSCRSIRTGEGHMSALGRAGAFRDTGCFRGQVESRVLASGDLLVLGRGGQGQLRAESGVGLWNQVPLIHFW